MRDVGRAKHHTVAADGQRAEEPHLQRGGGSASLGAPRFHASFHAGFHAPLHGWWIRSTSRSRHKCGAGPSHRPRSRETAAQQDRRQMESNHGDDPFKECGADEGGPFSFHRNRRAQRTSADGYHDGHRPSREKIHKTRLRQPKAKTLNPPAAADGTAGTFKAWIGKDTEMLPGPWPLPVWPQRWQPSSR